MSKRLWNPLTLKLEARILFYSIPFYIFTTGGPWAVTGKKAMQISEAIDVRVRPSEFWE